MTDSDVIKALGYCINNNHGCELCPLNCDPIYCRDVYEIATRIVCLQAENDHQQTEIERLKAEKDNLIRNYKECAMEVVRDFAERLKEKAYKSCEWWPILRVVDAKDIDEFVAKMESENDRT